MVYAAALLSILLIAVAQVLLKMGVQSACSPKLSASAIVPLLTDTKFLAGIAAYGLSLLLWLHVLSQLEVSRAYPLVSLGYIITMVIAYLWLGEPLSVGKAVGTTLIVVGVFLISRY